MIEQQQTTMAFVIDFSELVKMINTTEEWPAFSTHLEEFVRIKGLVSSFSLSLIPCSSNSKSDNLALELSRLILVM